MQSFFGRTYNNLSSISECKNNGECIINKKNRTACKACRLRKCLLVGMSKSGSRYGRRSNWFKIHCLLQEQQHKGSGGGGGGGNHRGLPISPNSGHNNNNNSHSASNIDNGGVQNSFMPPNFPTNLCNGSLKNESNITRSPSDSGASSADPDENNRDGSIGSFSIDLKTEKSSITSPPEYQKFVSVFSPFLYERPANVTVKHDLPWSTVIYSTPSSRSPLVTTSSTGNAAKYENEQNEPMDLSFKTYKRERTPSPHLLQASNIFDIPKPIPLDLTLVKSRQLSG